MRGTKSIGKALARALPAGAEGHARRRALSVEDSAPVAQHGGRHRQQRLQDSRVRGARAARRQQGLVVVERLVAGDERGRRLGGAVRGAPGRLRHHEIDHVAHPLAAPQGLALPRRRAAPGQGLGAQLLGHDPAAVAFELWPQLFEHAPHQHAGGHGARTGEVDQLTLEARAGRAPHGRAVQRRRDGVRRLAALVALTLAHDDGAEQRGDQHDRVHRRAGVAHAHLDRGHVRRGAHVEVDHAAVADDAGGDEVLDFGLVAGGRGERAGAPGGGPA